MATSLMLPSLLAQKCGFHTRPVKQDSLVYFDEWNFSRGAPIDKRSAAYGDSAENFCFVNEAPFTVRLSMT